jgi:hypothetical protein
MIDSLRLTTEKDEWLSGVKVVDTVAPNRRARFAAEFINRWGAVAAIPDGEDSVGRQQMRLATPEELVERACETAELLHQSLVARGWLVDIPAPGTKDGL